MSNPVYSFLGLRAEHPAQFTPCELIDDVKTKFSDEPWWGSKVDRVIRESEKLFVVGFDKGDSLFVLSYVKVTGVCDVIWVTAEAFRTREFCAADELALNIIKAKAAFYRSGVEEKLAKKKEEVEELEELLADHAADELPPPNVIKAKAAFCRPSAEEELADAKEMVKELEELLAGQ